MFTLTSCNKNQKIIEEKILAINNDFNKKIISEYGLIYNGKDMYLYRNRSYRRMPP